MDKPLIKFTDEERALLRKHFDFYKSLSRGWRKATTKAQTHFIEVCKKKATAETPHERAWVKQISRDALEAKKEASWDALEAKRKATFEEKKRKAKIKATIKAKEVLNAKRMKSNITHDWRL